jgi:predicted permease
MRGTLTDLLFGFRLLVRSPLVTGVVVLSLALGIGANTAMFSVLNTLLLRPLAVNDIDQVVAIYTSYSDGNRLGITSYPDFADIRDRNDFLDSVAAHTYAPMGLRVGKATEVVAGQMVSASYFSVLGVEPHLGRTFLPEEDQTPDTHPVVVLAHHTWQNRFGSDPDVVDSTIHINDHPFTVIGVAPSGFTGLSVALTPELWVPTMMVNQVSTYSVNLRGRVDPWLFLVGRLKPGVAVESAQTAADLVAESLRKDYPELNATKGLTVVPMESTRIIVGQTIDGPRAIMTVLMVFVGLVLLIACCNAANLLLARASGRRRELGLRSSLGATSARLLRQLLTESLLLATAAGFLGLLLAGWFLGLLVSFAPTSEMPIQPDLGIDGRVLLFCGVLSLVTTGLFGLIPALRSSRTSRWAMLREQGSAPIHSRATSRLQQVLVAGQVALSLVLLVTAGLFLRSLQEMLRVEPGFALREGLVVPVNLAYSSYNDTQTEQLFQELQQRVQLLPGIRRTFLAAFLPLSEVHGHHDFVVEGYEPAPGEHLLVKRNMVDPGYFETLGVRIVRGRAIDSRDLRDSQPVAVINQTMANRYWPGLDPLGKEIRLDLGIPRIVVGIAEDGKYGSRDEAPQPYVCIQLSQQPEVLRRLNLVIATDGPPDSQAVAVSRIIRQLDGTLPMPPVMTVDQYLQLSVQGTQLPAVLTGSFGLLALGLALMGVFSIMAYSVSQRSRELAIRMALGASRHEIVGLVMRQGLLTTLAGVAAGLLLTTALTGTLRGALFGVSSFDVLVLATIPAALTLTCLLASFLPAHRAGAFDPGAILRSE